jgi:hypothetical protein
VEDVAYTFDGPADARAYLREVGRLWALWVVGVVAILVTHGVLLIALAVAVLVALLVGAAPLWNRVEKLVPVNRREGGRVAAAWRGGTTRDRVLRELAYGDRPIRAALKTAGLSPAWIAARHVVVAGTVIAFVFVVLGELL